jgi:hypothetical protein
LRRYRRAGPIMAEHGVLDIADDRLAALAHRIQAHM